MPRIAGAQKTGHYLGFWSQGVLHIAERFRVQIIFCHPDQWSRQAVSRWRAGAAVGVIPSFFRCRVGTADPANVSWRKATESVFRPVKLDCDKNKEAVHLLRDPNDGHVSLEVAHRDLWGKSWGCWGTGGHTHIYFLLFCSVCYSVCQNGGGGVTPNGAPKCIKSLHD